MVNQRLQDANGKIVDLQTIDFILILMEQIKYKEFFGDNVSLLKTIKEWTNCQRKTMVKQTKEFEELEIFFKSINYYKMK